jgi:hypothetical protein
MIDRSKYLGDSSIQNFRHNGQKVLLLPCIIHVQLQIKFQELKFLTKSLIIILKPVFHFNRIVTYRSIFFCVKVISSTVSLRKQRNTLRFGTIRLKWKTALRIKLSMAMRILSTNNYVSSCRTEQPRSGPFR